MILLEPSEAKSNTRLPSAIIRAASIVIGLEATTGADFIISLLSKPKMTTITAAPVHQIQLAQHCKSGALVQRKDGRDFLSSIPDLASIQERMMQWSGKIGPVMLIIGCFERGARGQTILDGKSTRTNWQAYSAAKMTWQARGGMLAELSSAQEITSWVNWLHGGFLSKISQDKLVVNRLPVQALVRPSNPWWSPLMALPHIGEHKAAALAEWLCNDRKTLAGAIAFISDLGNVHLDRPADFGPSTFEDCHTAFGLEPYERLEIALAAPPSSQEHLIVTWPVGCAMPTPDDGRRVKLPDGRVQIIYSREELKLAMEIMTGEEIPA